MLRNTGSTLATDLIEATIMTDGNRTAGGWQKTAQHVEQSCFTCTIGTD